MDGTPVPTFPAYLPLPGRAWGDDAGCLSEVPSFVVDEENALTLSALQPLLSGPDAEPFADERRCWPLLIVGPPGSGKSHIAQGVARRRGELEGSGAVTYYTGRDFARTLRSAVQDRNTQDLLDRLDSAKCLVIEDLEGLRQRPYAQQVLRQLLDRLLDRGCPVLVTSSKPPATLRGFEPGLIDRLSAGLIVRLRSPGPTARREILRLAAGAMGVELQQSELELLAEGSCRGVPALLRSLTEYAQRGKQNAAPVAAIVCPTNINTREIVAVVARYFNVTQAALRGPSRRRSLVHARSIASYLTRELTEESYTQIGHALGGRDHTTVMHAVRTIRKQLATDLETQDAVDQLQRILTAR